MGRGIDERLDSLEQLALAQQDALQSQGDLLLAASMLLTSLLALVDAPARETARQITVAALGSDPAHAGAVELVGKLTQDPRAAFLAHHGVQEAAIVDGSVTAQ